MIINKVNCRVASNGSVALVIMEGDAADIELQFNSFYNFGAAPKTDALEHFETCTTFWTSKLYLWRYFLNIAVMRHEPDTVNIASPAVRKLALKEYQALMRTPGKRRDWLFIRNMHAGKVETLYGMADSIGASKPSEDDYESLYHQSVAYAEKSATPEPETSEPETNGE